MTAPEPATAEELQQEIEQTRERLGQTVEELAAKADVKGQARAKATEVKARVTEMPTQLKRSEMMQRGWPLALTATGVLLMGSALVWRRRST